MLAAIRRFENFLLLEFLLNLLKRSSKMSFQEKCHIFALFLTVKQFLLFQCHLKYRILVSKVVSLFAIFLFQKNYIGGA